MCVTTMGAAKQAILKEITRGVPAAPSVLDAVVAIQKQRYGG